MVPGQGGRGSLGMWAGVLREDGLPGARYVWVGVRVKVRSSAMILR